VVTGAFVSTTTIRQAFIQIKLWHCSSHLRGQVALATIQKSEEALPRGFNPLVGLATLQPRMTNTRMEAFGFTDTRKRRQKHLDGGRAVEIKAPTIYLKAGETIAELRSLQVLILFAQALKQSLATFTSTGCPNAL
jgi:hypothetical protein